jgi:cytochrome P450
VSTVAVPSASPTPPTPQPPSPNRLGGPVVRLKRKLATALTARAVMRPAFGLLRRRAPVLRVGRQVVVSRFPDVLEVLHRDADFTLSEVNGPPIDRINGPFILNMDRGPTYERDHAVLRSVTRDGDLDRVRALARETAESLVAAARPAGRIDAVQGLARAVAARTVAVYFGFPGPDPDTLVRWLRNLFQDAFSNPLDDPFVRSAALRSAGELKAWALEEIPRRRVQGVAGADDVLGRMIELQGPERPWLDDDWVRRNVAGLVVGAIETTSRFGVLAVDELLRRPAELAGAQQAARSGDMDLVRQYAWEAVRFNPHTPLMARFCPREATIARGTPRERRIPAGTTVLLGIDSAMFDPAGFPEPRRFRVDRDVRSYLHFGWGLHQCFGLPLNRVQVPEIVGALLRLPGLRRAPARAGRVALDGPFPDRLLLAFD